MNHSHEYDEQQNSLYAAIVGDYNIHVVSCGMSHDVDSMFVGWVHMWNPQSMAPARVTGITWDQARILVDCSQPLQPREIDVLIDAGFLVDESFM